MTEQQLPNSRLAAALRYARAGWPVFPCQPGEKIPATRHGFLDATTDADKITWWWTRHPGQNVAIATGMPGPDVLDVDVHPDGSGYPAFNRLRSDGLLDGARGYVRTPSGGLHAYFTGTEQGNGRLPRHHLDFRSHGGYVLAPPSQAAGKPYQLIGHREGQARLDWAAVTRLLDPQPQHRPDRAIERPGDVSHLAGWVARLTEGNRNDGLFWAANRALDAGQADLSDLADAARQTGLDEREITRTLASARRRAAALSPLSRQPKSRNRTARGATRKHAATPLPAGPRRAAPTVTARRRRADMGVYVDDLQLWAGVRRHDIPWSHLFADTEEELHAFALRLGIGPEWFDQGKHPWLTHYDVTAGWRQQAIKLGATAVTIREAKQILRVRAAEAETPRSGSQHVQRKRHSWEKQDKHHKTCRDCGIKALARPHPYERRWYLEYTTADGRCFTADRVPPCDPALQPQPVPDDQRVRHASELDRAAGRAWQHGDLQRAARLIADARALDPARRQLWDTREATIAASAPRPAHRPEPAPAGPLRSCSAPHPHQDAYLAARRSMEAGDSGRCHDGHPVSDLAQDVAARLTAAGYTASSPELARIRKWNRRAFGRAGTRPPDPAAAVDTP